MTAFLIGLWCLCFTVGFAAGLHYGGYVKLLWGHKDGGPESHVRCWGIECKGLFSVLLLCFGQGSREAFHTHAFNSVSWLLRGRLLEHGRFSLPAPLEASALRWYRPSWRAIYTKRHWMHRVEGGHVRNWVFTLRGPWVDHWQDGPPGGTTTLTHGRKERL